jgi:hypothetical protein
MNEHKDFPNVNSQYFAGFDLNYNPAGEVGKLPQAVYLI